MQIEAVYADNSVKEMKEKKTSDFDYSKLRWKTVIINIGKIDSLVLINFEFVE